MRSRVLLNKFYFSKISIITYFNIFDLTILHLILLNVILKSLNKKSYSEFSIFYANY